MFFLRQLIFILLALFTLFVFSSDAFSTNKLLIVNGTILTMKPGDKPFTGYLLIDENGKIKAVDKGAPPEDYTDLVM